MSRPSHPLTFAAAVIVVVLAVALAAAGKWQAGAAGAILAFGVFRMLWAYKGPSYEEESARATEQAKTAGIARWRGGSN